MNLPRVSWYRTLVAGLLVPALTGCDSRDDAPRQTAALPLLKQARMAAPDKPARPSPDTADEEHGGGSAPASHEAATLEPAARSPHAGVYIGSIPSLAREPACGSDDGDAAGHSSAALDSDSDTETVLLLAVDATGRIHGYVRGAPGLAADEWLWLRDTIAPHQTCAPVLLRDRSGRGYGALTLDFKRGGRYREVLATLQRKGQPALSFAALALDGAATLGTDDRFVARELELEIDARRVPRAADTLELHLGAADAQGTLPLRASTEGATLHAQLRPSGVDGLYTTTLRITATGEGSPAAAAHTVDGLGIVERLADGRRALTLVGADARARVLLEASSR